MAKEEKASFFWAQADEEQTLQHTTASRRAKASGTRADDDDRSHSTALHRTTKYTTPRRTRRATALAGHGHLGEQLTQRR
ncbi:hypothetical protein Dda_8618 [Drechslerella dactyloides]|uniref:Uncharacterized protein n=1 Tax=Drechslerella dactyloides TaxID=74499 RepID=A0AAD6NEX4_DREDA|nr:hypothetical protein Dda_8618 [Drechslerella dactyloides]